MDTSAIFRFGFYESRPRTRELYLHGSKLKIRPQPLTVLNLLLSRAGDVVTREELRQELWSSETFVDFEHSLNTSIKEIRAVLNDSAATPRYVETLPRLGYRFIAPVEKIESSGQTMARTEAVPADAAAESAAALPVLGGVVSRGTSETAGEESAASSSEEVLGTQAAGAASSSRFSRAAVVALAAAVAVVIVTASVVGYRWTHAAAKPKHANAERAMIAVLPFENLTGDAAQDYFSDGLTEEMIAQLGHLDPQHLGVIARTSVMHYQHNPEPLDQIARELGVQYVLEGSVRRDGDKVRVTAELIQTSDQNRIWSRQYDRELDNLLSLQTEIASEISTEIQLSLGEPQPRDATAAAALESPAPPKNYGAYDDYLKGRYFWNKRTGPGFQRAIECFQQSVAKDPTYAPAYAGLADSYALIAEYDIELPSEAIPKARAAALKALSLDDKLAEAHASLGVIAQNYDWDWQTSEKEFRRAIALDPNYATGHHWYAEHLALLGRFDEAFPEMQRALELDPLSLIMKADNGVFLYFARQNDRAIQQLLAVNEMEPDFSRGHMIVFPYMATGRFDDALAALQQWQKTDKVYWNTALEAEVYARAGRTAEARRDLAEVLRVARTKRVDPYTFIGPYIALGENDQAFRYLDEAIANHSPSLTALKVNPIFDPIRRDPRFAVALQRVGLG